MHARIAEMVIHFSFDSNLRVCVCVFETPRHQHNLFCTLDLGEVSSPSTPEQKQTTKSKINNNFKLPSLDPKTNSYIPPSTPTNGTPDSKLPPICVSTRTEFKYAEVNNNEQLIERLQTQQLKFMVQRNFYVLVKIVECKFSTITSFLAMIFLGSFFFINMFFQSIHSIFEFQ